MLLRPLHQALVDIIISDVLRPSLVLVARRAQLPLGFAVEDSVKARGNFCAGAELCLAREIDEIVSKFSH